MARSKVSTFFRRLLITLGLLVLVGAVVGWSLLPARYEAFALLRIASRPPVVLKGGQHEADFAMFKSTQAQLVTSSVVLNAAVREKSISSLPSVAEHEDDLIGWLRDAIEVTFPGDAEVMRVSLTTSHKDDAPILVDSVVNAYLREIVQQEKSIKMASEAKLQQAFEKSMADYQRQLDALVALERTHGTGSSEAARLKRQIALDELNLLVADRAELQRQTRDNELQIALARSRAQLDAEAKQADMVTLRTRGFDEPLALPLLERKQEFLSDALAKANQAIEQTANEISSLERISAHVTAKQEEVQAVRLLKQQLGSEVERLKIERLANERITIIDDTQLVDESGDALRRNLGFGVLAGVGLALLAVGLVVGRARGSSEKSAPAGQLEQTQLKQT